MWWYLLSFDRADGHLVAQRRLPLLALHVVRSIWEGTDEELMGLSLAVDSERAVRLRPYLEGPVDLDRFNHYVEAISDDDEWKAARQRGGTPP